jgi:hypothetical protein
MQKCSHCEQPALDGEGLCGPHFSAEEDADTEAFNDYWADTEFDDEERLAYHEGRN